MSLSVLTGKRSIRKLAHNYVYSVEISDEQTVYYEDYGISREQAANFLSSKPFRDLITDVMVDKMSVLFRHRTTYYINRDDCERELRLLLEDFASECELEVSSDEIDALTRYTFDMAGLTSMFLYNTPSAYKDSMFDNGSKYEELNNTFETLANLSSPMFPVSLFLMYLICVGMLLLFMWRFKDIIAYKLGDTAIMPSLIILAFCFGELFCMKEPTAIQTYIYRTGAIISVLGIVFGIMLFGVGTLISKANEDVSKGKKKGKRERKGIKLISDDYFE